MAGIYIPGMEMPRKGQMLVIFPDGASYVCFNGMRERMAQTTAVPVSPHGDLIDRDVLETFRELVTTDVPGGKLTREYVSMAAVRNVKTIIPADKEGEE